MLKMDKNYRVKEVRQYSSEVVYCGIYTKLHFCVINLDLSI